MKRINKFILSGALLLGAVAFTSCSKDETYDYDGINYERVYMQNPNTTKSGTVLKTPVGYIAGFSGKVAVQTTGAMTSPTNVNLAVDNSLVDSYNAANKTSYEAIPDGVVSLEKSSLTIAAGKIVSDTVNIVVSEEGYSKLKADVSYLVPVTIKDASGSDAQLAKDSKYRSNYFVLKYMETNSLIRTEGSVSDLIGTPTTEEQGKTWSCIAAEDLNPEGFSGLYDESSWDFLSGKEVLKASFTIDLGASHKIGGFSISSYLIKYSDIQISSDNAKWTDVGDTQNAQAIRDDNWNEWYGFYASMAARYVKMTLTLNSSSWAWNYPQWGYCSISSFQLRFDD